MSRAQVFFTKSLMAVIACGFPAFAQGPYVNFETSLVKPLHLTGDRLLVVNNVESTLVVYDVSGIPRITDEIPVGLEPVSIEVRPGHPDEAWVVNSVSDDVSIVDLALGTVVAVIKVGDEPADVAFTADGAKAYVTIGEEDKIAVIDAVTRTVISTIDSPAVAPRTIESVQNGRFMVVSSFKSGNKTTILPFNHPQAPPSNPKVGLIIPDDDPRSSLSLPDVDVFAIKTSVDQVLSQTITGLGTILFSHAIHPTNGKLYVTNTEALNLTQFEPEVRGHIVDNRVSIVSKVGAIIEKNLIDLNPHVNYDVLPDPDATALSLAQPTDLVFDLDNERIFVAAFGSALVGVLSETGDVIGRIPVGIGPRGLALSGENNRLYCLNRIDNTLSEIDTTTLNVVSTFPVGNYDPRPAVIREGQEFLYDARLSGNGTASCASCHVDGDTDMLAWDLGDPNGIVVPGPEPGISFAPKKGPMTTQTLRGLKGTGPLHWRGDRPEFIDFNPAFVGLMGLAVEIPDDDMLKFQNYVNTIRFAPNPNMNPDRSFSRNGRSGFVNFKSTAPFFGLTSCVACHELPFGSGFTIIPRQLLAPISQDFKPGKLQATYHKEGRFDRTGFGLSHDGATADLNAFLSFSPPFPPFSNALIRNFSQFVMEFDTGTAPTIGFQLVVDATNVQQPGVIGEIERIIVEEIPRAHCDLIVHGLIRGERHGFYFNPKFGKFLADDSTLGRISTSRLLGEAAAGRAILVFKAVPVGSGVRMAIDRDNDCLPNFDELRIGTSPIDPDTDRDGWRDGWELLEGSDPTDIGSVPQSLTAPVVLGVPSTPGYKPYNVDLKVIRLNATGVFPGALLAATPPGGGETLVFPIFPTRANEYTATEPLPTRSVSDNARGWTFVIRNKTGASSPPFVAP